MLVRTSVFFLAFLSKLIAPKISMSVAAEDMFVPDTEQKAPQDVYNDQKSSIPFIQKGTDFAAESLGSLLLQRILHIDGKDTSECAIAICNGQLSNKLVNPLVYIEHGASSLPPPLTIGANSCEATTFNAIIKLFISDTSGILSYEIQGTKVRLFIYWKVGFDKSNRFVIKLDDVYDESQTGLKSLYDELDASPDMIKTKGPMSHLSFDTVAKPLGPEKLMVKVRAQMNMLPQAELMVSISDNNPSELNKRALATTVSLSLTGLTLNTAFKKIMSYIPSKQSCTILIENQSQNFSLVDPVWYVTAGQVVNLLSSEIKSGEIGEASITIPFGGPKLKDSFTHTIFFVCYQIEGTRVAVVVATWFPLKLQMNNNRYSIFLMYFSNTKIPITTQAGEVLSILGDNLIAHYDNPARLEESLASIPQLEPFLTANSVNNRFPMVKAGPYQTYHEWNFPGNIPKLTFFGTGVKFVKVVAAIGNGYKSGLSLKVEVHKGGLSPGVPLPNPQIYKEKPSKELTQEVVKTIKKDTLNIEE